MSKSLTVFDLDNYMDRKIEFVKEHYNELKMIIREEEPGHFPRIIADLDLSFNDVSFICGFLTDYILAEKMGRGHDQTLDQT